MEISELFTKDWNVKELKCSRGPYVKDGETGMYYRDSRKYFFSDREVGRWNSLDQETVDAPSVNFLEGRVDELRQKWAFMN